MLGRSFVQSTKYTYNSCILFFYNFQRDVVDSAHCKRQLQQNLFANKDEQFWWLTAHCILFSIISTLNVVNCQVFFIKGWKQQDKIYLNG